jgi:hypothetical protein
MTIAQLHATTIAVLTVSGAATVFALAAHRCLSPVFPSVVRRNTYAIGSGGGTKMASMPFLHLGVLPTAKLQLKHGNSRIHAAGILAIFAPRSFYCVKTPLVLVTAVSRGEPSPLCGSVGYTMPLGNGETACKPSVGRQACYMS